MNNRLRRALAISLTRDVPQDATRNAPRDVPRDVPRGPPRARALNLSHTTSASLPEAQLIAYYLREPPGRPERQKP